MQVNVEQPVQMSGTKNTEPLPDLLCCRVLGLEDAGAIENVFDKFERQSYVEKTVWSKIFGRTSAKNGGKPVETKK